MLVGVFLWTYTMGYLIYKLQDTNYDERKTHNFSAPPNIVITEDDPGWEEALAKWKSGKNPTDSKLWKKGVCALTKLKEGG